MSKADRFSTDAQYHARPQWNPGDRTASSRLVACRNDGCDNEHVDRKFARILGDEDGNVYACPECTSWTALRHGAAAKPDFDPRVGRGWEMQGFDR